MGIENPSDPGNQRGAEIEEKIAKLIQGRPDVREVTITQKDMSDDREMRDLIVNLINYDTSINLTPVFVQAKASNRGIEHFNEELKKILIKQGITDQISLKEWMLVRKLILLNGDLVTSRSGKSSRHLTDEEILISFDTQLLEIVEHEKTLR